MTSIGMIFAIVSSSDFNGDTCASAWVLPSARRPSSLSLRPSAFARRPSSVSLCPSAFACQPSRPLFPPASPWPSAMVGGVWMVWPWLRSAFGTASGLLWDARPPSARPWRLGFLVSRLAVSVSECKVMAFLLPRCAIGCAAVRTRAIMCDEM